MHDTRDLNEIMTWAVITVGPDMDARVIGAITATDVIRAVVGTAGKRS